VAGSENCHCHKRGGGGKLPLDERFFAAPEREIASLRGWTMLCMPSRKKILEKRLSWNCDSLAA
jgi:hypothetical protein